MTRDDTKRILDKICRLYITQAKKMSTDEMVMMLDSWEETFSSDSYDDIERAVNAYVRKGNAFIPLPGDIIKELTAIARTTGSSGKGYTETDKLFVKLVNIADVLANNKERISIVDPGGFRWSDEHQRKIYAHAETVVSTTSYTQYDFKQLPEEIQEYVEDIEGLKSIWREIASSREMARKRFQAALPDIKARLSNKKTVRLADVWEAM
jgi:adenylosuccinate synthase